MDSEDFINKPFKQNIKVGISKKRAKEKDAVLFYVVFWV